MIKLIHTDVDGYLSCFAEWDQMPSLGQLSTILVEYYDNDQAVAIAGELIKYREADVDDSSSTRFALL